MRTDPRSPDLNLVIAGHVGGRCMPFRCPRAFLVRIEGSLVAKPFGHVKDTGIAFVLLDLEHKTTVFRAAQPHVFGQGLDNHFYVVWHT